VVAAASSSTASNKPKVPTPAPVKKDAKKSLKGVLVKKKPKASTALPAAATPAAKAADSKNKADSVSSADIQRKDGNASKADKAEPHAKRRRISEPNT